MTINKIIFICLCLTYGIVKSYACNCSEIPTIEESLKRSAIVVSGKVLSVTYTSDYDSLGLFTNPKRVESTFQELGITSALVRIKVEYVFHGWLYTNAITIITPSDEASCGFEFIAGQRYIMYAWIADEDQAARLERHSDYERIVFSTGLCTRTQPWHIEEHDEILKVTGG